MKKFIYVSLIVILLLTITLSAFACKKEKSSGEKFDPTKSYESGIEKFWIGLGKAYISLNEGKFAVNVSYKKDPYSAWLEGEYEYDEENDALIITATWEDKGSDTTKLTDGESGKPKTYKFVDGVCEIKVDLPSAGSMVFKIIC